jgi:hypothetical protein
LDECERGTDRNQKAGAESCDYTGRRWLKMRWKIVT